MAPTAKDQSEKLVTPFAQAGTPDPAPITLPPGPHIAVPTDAANLSIDLRKIDPETLEHGKLVTAFHAARGQIAHLEAQNVEKDRQIAELEEIAATDPKTGILNRRGADRVLHTMVYQFLRDHDGKRHGSDRIMIAFIDLDGLKTTNDIHGHDKGDKLLTNFVGNVRPHVRTGDPFARIGGDEFLVIMNTNKPSGAKTHFLGVRAELDQISADAPVEQRTAFSIGFTYLSHMKLEKFLNAVRKETGNPDIKAKDLDVAALCDGLIKEADADMYKDKAPRKAAREAKARLAAAPAGPAAPAA